MKNKLALSTAVMLSIVCSFSTYISGSNSHIVGHDNSFQAPNNKLIDIKPINRDKLIRNVMPENVSKHFAIGYDENPHSNDASYLFYNTTKMLPQSENSFNSFHVNSSSNSPLIAIQPIDRNQRTRIVMPNENVSRHFATANRQDIYDQNTYLVYNPATVSKQHAESFSI